MKQTFPDVPGWTFKIDEVSANVYEVKGTDSVGHKLQMKGTDPDALLEDARKSAKRIREASH